jgi:S-adenosylmethionine:tRNA ribosyltransferase-isomerase
MRISEFHYELPQELIAQQPLARRDASRMLVIDRAKQSWFDSEFSAFPQFLQSNDVLVLNDTRVFPARLVGKRHPSGGSVEVMLVRELAPLEWEALVRPSQRLRHGSIIRFGGSRLSAELLDDPGDELRRLRFDSQEPFTDLLDELGQTPLPPYIKREVEDADDRARYQTIFAARKGAVAAPTAGLHFTDVTLNQINERGTDIAKLTLHVGYGTFAPVRVDDVEKHKVAAESFELSEDAVKKIWHARANGGRVVAVGTTTTRALESSVNARGEIGTTKKLAEITITPGYEFKATDVLLTNFHLPQSSLLLLVSAFAGKDLVLAAYRHAVEHRYRFYSYGDCMLIL